MFAKKIFFLIRYKRICKEGKKEAKIKLTHLGIIKKEKFFFFIIIIKLKGSVKPIQKIELHFFEEVFFFLGIKFHTFFFLHVSWMTDFSTLTIERRKKCLQKNQSKQGNVFHRA